MVRATRTSPRPTITDVARAAGVSITTVSHALNGRGFVDPATREHVKQVARKLEYRPNRHAQRLRGGGAHTIVLLSSMPFGVSAGPSRLGFLMEIAAVAAEAALTHGMALILAPSLDGMPLPLDTLDVDGALVLEPALNDRSVDYLREHGIPVVAIGKQPGSDRRSPYVDLHSATTTRILVEHLHAQGARHVALMIGSECRNSYVEAESAYRKFVEDTGMSCHIVRADEAGGEQSGYRAALGLLSEHPEIDAICVPVDAFAVGAVRAVTEMGRRVPADIKLATRYNGLRAINCSPPLTAVDQHLEQVALAAVQLLFAHLSGDTGQTAVAGPEPTLIVRASSAVEHASAETPPRR